MTRLHPVERAAIVQVVTCIEAFILQMEAGVPIFTAGEVLHRMRWASAALRHVGNECAYPADQAEAFAAAVAAGDDEAADLFSRWVLGERRALELVSEVDTAALRDASE